MQRRRFLRSAGLAASAFCVAGRCAEARPLKGSVRKSLNWNIVKDHSLPLADTFQRPWGCGFEGIEPRFSEVDAAAESSDSSIERSGTGRGMNRGTSNRWAYNER